MILKKTILVGLLAAIAMAFSAGSALAWTNAATHVFSNAPSTGNPIVLQIQTTGLPEVSCDDVNFTAVLDGTAPPPLIQDYGTVPSGTMTSCTTTIPNCTLNFVRIEEGYSGASCPLNGVTIVFEGNLDADVTYTAAGCGAGEQRTRADFDFADGLDVTASSGGIAFGTPVRLDGFVDTPCVDDRANPEMTAGTS